MKEDVLKFYKDFKVIIIPAAIAIFSIALIIFVIIPQITKLLSNQAIAKELAERSKFLEAKAQTLESYDTSQLDLKIKSVLSSYPVDRDYVNTLILLQNIISQSGFTITSLSLGTSSEGGSGQKYGFNITVLGSKDKLPKFLQNIEGSYRLMRISNLETSSEKNEQISAALNIDVLYAPPPNSFGNIDSPLPQFTQKEEEVLSKLATVGSLTNTEEVVSQTGVSIGKDNPFE